MQSDYLRFNEAFDLRMISGRKHVAAGFGGFTMHAWMESSMTSRSGRLVRFVSLYINNFLSSLTAVIHLADSHVYEFSHVESE